MVQPVQDLNDKTGVAPTPAYYLRGEAVPSITTCLHDENGQLVGCANATMRYNSAGRLAGTLFAGAVSIDPNHRRKGYGTLVNAALLRDSHASLGWVQVLEQAKADNTASCGMIEACGLRQDPDLATIVVNLSSDYITR